MAKDSKQIVVELIVTCLNEEGNVETFIHDLMRELSSKIDLKLILINNGSNDNTGSIIESLAKQYASIFTIQREITLEYGYSILDALNSTENQFSPDYIGWAPSDNQITGKDVNRTLNALLDHDLDFIKVDRIEKNYSLWRRIQSFSFNAIMSFLFLRRIKDINGSPKFFRAEFLPFLSLNSKTWFLDSEAYLKAVCLSDKSKITSISVRFNERAHGRSNTSWITAFELFLDALYFRFWILPKWKNNLKIPNTK